MKKRILSLLLALVMVLGLLPGYALAAGGTVEGSGTAEEPYVIEDAADLLAVKNNLAGQYILAADISPATWTADLGLFTGTLDGNGYTITLPKGAVGGLFKSGTSGTIKNLTLRAEEVTSASTNAYAGILVDGFFNGKIYNCSVVGNLTFSTTKTEVYAGGFCARVNTSTAVIDNCFAAVTLTYQYSGTVEGGAEAPTATKHFGALAGASGTQWQKGKLTNCYYDSTLFETAIEDDKAAQAANCVGKTTEECKSLAESLNTNVPEGLLSWKDTDSYPVFASHSAVLSGSVTLTGEAEVGKTLTVEDTFDEDNTNQKLYTWYRVDAFGNESKIEGVTSASYTLTAVDLSYQIKVVASQVNTVGSRTTEKSARVSTEDTITVSSTGGPEGVDVILTVKNSAGAVVGSGKTVDIPTLGSYTWFASADGYNTDTGTFTANGEDVTVTVEMTALSEVEWSSEKVNGMQIGDLDEMPRFPTSSENAALKWATCAGLYGSKGVGMNGEVTNPVFMDDYIYIIGGEGGKQQILKINPENGDILKRVFVHGQGGYYYFLACGGGLIYFRGNGYVQAFDKDLNEAWLYEDSTIPTNYAGSIVYDGGFIYFGTAVSRNNGVANFYCLSASDGSLVWKMRPELDYDNGGTTDYWGFYWANPLVIGDYVLCGSDGGRLYVWNRYTGEVVDRLDPGVDMGYTGKNVYQKPFIRSGIVTDGEGRIYFTSSDGYVHMANFNSTTGKISGHKFALIGTVAGSGGNSTFAGNSSSSTPVVYNGRLYAASDTSITVYRADTLEKIYSNDVSNKSGFSYRYNKGQSGTWVTANAFGKIRDLRLMVGEDGTAYVFSSHYTGPGSVVMFKDAPGQTESTGYISFASLTGEYGEYNATSPIIGPDGTIYCTNDFGYLMALEKMDACLTSLTVSTGTMDKEFSSTTRSYELVVPRGTQSVTLTLAATEGASVKVNDTTVTGTADVALTDGKASAKIVVTLGNYSLTYTISIREASNNTDIGVLTSSDNNINSNTSLGVLAKGVDNAYAVTDCTGEDFDAERLWLGTVDPNASMTKPVISGYNASSLNGTDVYNGVAYQYRFFFGDTLTAPRLASTTVTAEDGVTKKTYYAAMFKSDASAILAHDANEDGAFDPETEYLMAASISKSSHAFTAAEEEITLTSSAEYAGKAPENTTLTWASSDSTVAEVDEGGKVKILKHGSAVISAKNADGLGAECVVTLNAAPALKDGVSAATTAEITVGESYTLDLTGIFTDADSDTLTYTVKVGDADETSADASYTYTPASKGTYTLVFTASDGMDTSASYTVTLTVKSASTGPVTPVEPKSITVYVSLSDDSGKFITGKDGITLWNVELAVYDEDGDGKYTLDEAMLTLHDEYHPDGTSAYAGGSYISKLWGEPGGNYGFVVNNKWCTGAPTKLKKNDKINVFFYQDWDSGDYSDLYTYFDSTSYTAKTGTEKTFTVNGLNIMWSYENSNAYGTPKGADVTVYNSDGVSVMTAVTDEKGKFALTFSDPGTYTIEVSGTCDYTASGEYGNGSFTDAPVAPARCTVTVSGKSTGESGSSTVPSGSADAIVEIKTTVSGSNATVKATDEQIEKAAASGAGTVIIDVSDLKNVESATLPSNVVKKTNEAKDTGLTVCLPAGSVALDETALVSVAEAAQNRDVTVSVASVSTDKLSTVVKEIIGMKPTVVAVVDVNLTIGGTKQSTFNGGKLTISVPYTPKSGEDTSKLTVWFIKDDGTIENKGGRYDAVNKCFVFETDHLSQYLLVNTNDLVRFTDVPTDAYYAAAVNWAADKNITSGVGNDLFAPEQNCSRAEMVTFLWRAAGSPVPKSTTQAFKDVDEKSWYAQAVLWAVENGITQGTGADTFSPDALCSRSQMALFLYRMAGSPAVSGGESAFTDVPAGAYYADAVRWAVEKGITKGTGNGAFSPEMDCSRSQMVTFLYRFLAD